jgi:hypothetical protein
MMAREGWIPVIPQIELGNGMYINIASKCSKRIRAKVVLIRVLMCDGLVRGVRDVFYILSCVPDIHRFYLLYPSLI